MRSMKDLYRKIMKVALIFAGLFAFFFLINLFYLVTNGAFDVAGNSFSISDEYQMARFNFWFSGSLIIAFILLGLHLAHGFQSAFQSMGFNNKYTSCVKSLGKWYSILIPLGFIVIALFHHFNQLNH